jgi:hypothetical protein
MPDQQNITTEVVDELDDLPTVAVEVAEYEVLFLVSAYAGDAAEGVEPQVRLVMCGRDHGDGEKSVYLNPPQSWELASSIIRMQAIADTHHIVNVKAHV